MAFSRLRTTARRVAAEISAFAEPLGAVTARALEIATARETRPRTQAVLARLQTEPPRPTYPLRWTSARQRRAYFATNGFGAGIPYRRSGQLRAGWRVSVTFWRDGGLIELRNAVDYAPFVQGAQVQSMHLDTGWVQPSAIADEFQTQVYDAASFAFFDVVSPVTQQGVL